MGIKKSVGFSNATYTVMSVVDHYVSNGSTINLCTSDVSKAFDKMNHHGLLMKMMSHRFASRLVINVRKWFSNCITDVKWSGSRSNSFSLTYDISQGGVLSPYLITIYIDDSIVDIT